MLTSARLLTVPDPSTALDAANGCRVHGLTGHNVAKVLWLYLWPTLREGGTVLVKVRVCAADLTIKPRDIRRALARLVAVQLVRCVHPSTRWTAGSYTFGPAAFRPTARREYARRPDIRRHRPQRLDSPPTPELGLSR